MATVTSQNPLLSNEIVTVSPARVTADFSLEPAVTAVASVPVLKVSSEEWKARLRKLSLLFKDTPAAITSTVSLSWRREVKTLVNSEGTQQQPGRTFATLTIVARGKAMDGEDVVAHESFDAEDPARLPKDDVLAASVRKAIATLEKANDDPGNPVRAPLLLMTDQEGGLVKRLSGEPLLSEKYIGLSADPLAAATKAGAGAAANLAAVGMNLNLAPVLDVYRTAGDFDDQYRRSYSTDPKVCGQLGAAFIGAQQKGGVAATAKHFPGLGAATATQNTDDRAVTLNVPAATLRSVDELPYKAAIAAGVKLVMLSWAIYPNLDPTLPAGLSPKVVQGELRDRLGFKGVTISDSFGATAALPFGSTRHRALLAAQAGLDLLLCGNQQIAQDAFGGLYDRYSDGTLPAAGFKAAVQRIVDLRYSLR